VSGTRSKAVEPDGYGGNHRVLGEEAARQQVLEAETTETELTAGRQGHRWGYYGRTLITRLGKLELQVPHDRMGRFSTELFERYQRSDRALMAALTSQGLCP
jgi:transposase-like protein